ncbi:MAG: glycosyltransferase family 39 protein [Bacteroidales bacterium]|nr:glycosyltransferase family 39 protein [Bacteroidales bacterium]
MSANYELMTTTFKGSKWPAKVFLFIIIAGFVIIKWHHLFLPYYWDEAWSYIPAIMEMKKVGPTLLPGAIDPELYRGHPLMFYFLTSAWLKLFGSSIFVSRVFPLLLSIALIIQVFQFAKVFFGKATAYISTLFFVIQAVFLAQSGFLLPEVLISLLSILCLTAYLKKQKLLFVVWASMLVLTKESGLVLILVILVHSIWELIRREKIKRFIPIIKSNWIMMLPLFVAGLFYTMQKISLGWFFFPEHIDFINISPAIVWSRFHGYAAYLFVYSGRNLLTFAGMAALIFLIVKKVKLSKDIKPIVSLISVFVLAYIAFSSINFYSPRYVLAVLPLVIILFCYFIRFAFTKYPVILFSLFIVVFANNIFFTIFNQSDADHNLGFVNTVKVHQAVVEFCEQEKIYDHTITTHFLMKVNLLQKSSGYLSSGVTFKSVNSELTGNTDFAIISSTEFNQTFLEQIKYGNGILVKRFERKNAWAEIYRFE